jgi:hypothetical protein
LDSDKQEINVKLHILHRWKLKNEELGKEKANVFPITLMVTGKSISSLWIKNPNDIKFIPKSWESLIA